MNATLTPDGLRRYRDLEADAIAAVSERFYVTLGTAYAKFGPSGREACKQDLAYHLEFLRPALEFGMLQSMVSYLRWLDSVLAARSIPTDHLTLSLDWLAEFFASRMADAEGAVVVAALREVRTLFASDDHEDTVVPDSPLAWPESQDFQDAILAGKQYEALALMTRCLDSGKNILDFELHVIQPALYSIGDLWQANQVSVAQEHMATAIVHTTMTMGLLRTAPPLLGDLSVLLACVEGNQHSVGLRMVADSFMLSGWNVQYLGANVPTTALIQHVEQSRPHLVGLSVSFAHQMPAVKLTIQRLKEKFGADRPSVIIGGLAINRFAPLAHVAGADSYASDAKAAVDTARSALGASLTAP
jgi:methanogenic corrinoid protein MtbC1